MGIEKYVVIKEKDDPLDGHLYDDYNEARGDAFEQRGCVVGLTFEFHDSYLLDDFTKEPAENEDDGDEYDDGPGKERTSDGSHDDHRP